MIAGSGMTNVTKAGLTHDEATELARLYDTFSLAVERASATMHMRGLDSPAFLVEDMKCMAVWGRIRALMEKSSR